MQGLRDGRGGGGKSLEEGFLLLGAIVAIFLVLLVLSLAAPTVARQLRREREVEAVHRGNQYVRAMQLYYKKFGHYPGTLEQLEKSNNIRFLRQKYVDPTTGKADWRLIHLGEQKTTVKGFFGQPLAGVASSGLGSLGGQASPGGVGASPSLLGAGGTNAAAGGTGFGQPGAGPAGFGGPSSPGSGGLSSAVGAGSTGTGTGGLGGTGAGLGSSGGIASQSATSFTGSGAPFVGIGSSGAGGSIVVLNEQTTYPTWEFIYDPRVEQMKAKVNILGGGLASGSGSGISGSSTPGGPIGAPATPAPGLTPGPTTAPPTVPQ